MKKNYFLLIQLLMASCCFAQTIDTSALHILQKSWDQLHTMETIHYRMRFVDTLLRENQLDVQWSSIRGSVKKNAYSHFKINDKLEWLIRGDTLYKKDAASSAVTFTTALNKPRIAARSIYEILGSRRPSLSNNTASLRFVQDTSLGEFYVIEQVYKVVNEVNDEIQNLGMLERYFINKKTLFAARRIKYGKSRLKGEAQTDIYDFSAALDTDPLVFNPAAFFTTSAEREEDRLATLNPGIIAPPFKATDVRTGKAVSLQSLKGKVVLLDFWYLSCPPCRALMPKLQKLQEKFGKENVLVVGINVRDSGPKAIKKFLDEKSIHYSQYYLPSQMLTWDYKLRAFPTTLVLGQDSRVKLVEIGADEGVELKLEKAIEKELNVKIAVPGSLSTNHTHIR